VLFGFYDHFEIFYFIILYEFFFQFVDGFLLKPYSLLLYFSFSFLHFFFFFFKYSSLFSVTSLVDLFVTDYPENSRFRFEVSYSLLSHFLNLRLFFKVFVSFFIFVPSVYFFFSSANWFERESWDLFGTRFLFHEDLRRILTDYNFNGHPMRKDFPLMGYLESRFDDIYKSMVWEPVELAQLFRSFSFNNVWRLSFFSFFC
jgi:NADH:ubiquinone oxidoreductase subunit C